MTADAIEGAVRDAGAVAAAVSRLGATRRALNAARAAVQRTGDACPPATFGAYLAAHREMIAAMRHAQTLNLCDAGDVRADADQYADAQTGPAYCRWARAELGRLLAEHLPSPKYSPPVLFELAQAARRAGIDGAATALERAERTQHLDSDGAMAGQSDDLRAALDAVRIAAGATVA